MFDSIHHLHHVNLWAVLVSALFVWFLGALWYSPALFAKPWMTALNVTPKGQTTGLAVGMVSSLLGDLVMAFVLLHIIVWSGATTWAEGAFVGFLAWLGFFAATQVPQAIYEGRPRTLFFINGGYWLLSLLAVGAVLAAWR